MSARTIYVAGPMRGYPNLNYAAFDDAAAQLRALGHVVHSPVDMDRDEHGEGGLATADGTTPVETVRAMLAKDIAVIAEHCDTIVVLPGWERSRGARAEVAFAVAIDVPVVALDEALIDGKLANLVAAPYGARP